MSSKTELAFIRLIKRQLEYTQRQTADVLSRMDTIYAHLEDLESDLEDGAKKE